MSLITRTFRNATDTFIVEKHKNRNRSHTTGLRVSGISTNNKHAYIHFPRPVPLGSTVLSATLTLYMPKPGSGTKTLRLLRLTQKWKHGRVTWRNKPAATATGAVSVTMASGTAGQEIVFDVKDFLQAVANGQSWYGWRIDMMSALERVINSAQAGNRKPVLEVTYATVPAKPTGLAPGGGNAVSVAKPLLRFNDVQAMTDFQVQIHSTSDFSGSPDWDSGVVASTVTQLDLENEAWFPGISEGEERFWRLRVRDNGGLWSPWSDVTSFSRAAVPTLTLLTPSGNDIDESRPTVSWSFTGTTQRTYQVLVRDEDNKNLHNSGQVDSSETEYEIPRGVITENDAEYKFIVRVWDDIDRDGADSAWFTDSTTATYNYSSSALPVTNLVATSLEPEPGIKLEWERGTTPDAFNIRSGNRLVEVVDIADAVVNGTTYEFIDYTAQPNRPQQYTVEAVVNGITSANNPVSDPITPNVKGIWISDPEDEIKVQLLDTDEGSWEMGEQSAVYTPVGSSRAFKVTQALRGYEGSISGLLIESHLSTKTVAEQEEDMWKIKSNPNRTYYLTLSDISIPVILGNIVVAPSPRKEIEKRVSLDFWQVGHLPFNSNL